MSRQVREMYRRPYDSWQNRIATLRFVQDIPLRPGDPSYALVDEVEASTQQLKHLPMLICWGMRDFVFDRYFLDLWEKRFPEARIHRFADCGHYVLEDASEEIVPLVQEFLKST